MGVPREQLHVPVRPLHVALRALLGRRHSDWLDRLRGWGGSGGRLRSLHPLRGLSRRRLLELGSRYAAGSGAGSGTGSAGTGSTSSAISLIVFLCFGVQEQCEGNAGAPGVYYVAVHIGELETQVPQGYGAV